MHTVTTGYRWYYTNIYVHLKNYFITYFLTATFGIKTIYYQGTSIDNFKDSVTEYASQWNLQDPSGALSNLTINKELSINSSKDSELLIETNPEDIYVLAKYITGNQKPREWLFLAEQAFLRSWNNLNR